MVRVKTKYKKYADGGAVISPAITVDIDREPAVNGGLSPQHDHVLDEGLAHLTDHIVEQNDPSVAFQKQIGAGRRAEEIQRQRQAASAPMPETREGRLVHLRNLGFSPEQSRYLSDFHENPRVAAEAIMAAKRDGLADETSQLFHDKVRGHFQLLNGVHPADIRLDGEPSPKANEFPEPAPAATPHHVNSIPGASEPQSRGSMMYSAPPSRDTVGGYNSNGERPGVVRLTVQQLEHAKAAGVTPKEYAEGVLRLREEQKNGRYGGEL
jgi:hypothetical protein